MNFNSSAEQRRIGAYRGLERKGARTGNNRMLLYAVGVGVVLAMGGGIGFIGLA